MLIATVARAGIVATLTILWTSAMTPAAAEIYVVDDTVAGRVYDGLLDGFPFPPPGTTPDGHADSVAGSLAVALKSGVTEERGIIELPLATLEGITASSVESATLTFNIDDVIGTFGPGTTFDGTAAQAIVLWSYAGNGAIDLADFENVAGAPLAIVDTTGFGVITDASLAETGALSFSVDVTAALVARMSAADGFFGIVMATQDDGTATSLDNLGNGGSGPAGTNGSFLPFLTVVTASAEPPVHSKSELGCQKAIGKSSGKLQRTMRAALAKCMDEVLAAAAKDKPLTAASASCNEALDPALPDSAVARGAAKLRSAVVAACEQTTPAALGTPCDDDATTFAEVADCLAARQSALAQESIASAYAAACPLLSAVELDLLYPIACQVD
ncbi:MAG TPA: hypothetical protein VEL28_01520 [Candidatus Binatia bacterium]|nr:hypothetical protein [Candidatus Binatia bacterium]